jgi:hypothetical protein
MGVTSLFHYTLSVLVSQVPYAWNRHAQLSGTRSPVSVLRNDTLELGCLRCACKVHIRII